MSSQTKVFIAGSRSLSRLSKEVLRRIDNMVEKDFTILVGDANGVDKAVQAYLRRKHYPKVVVFCMEGKCRNNIGQWPIEAITAPEPSKRDFVYFSTKDRAMVQECNYGLMLWDRQSKGTLTSILDLVSSGKPTVVYVAGTRGFYSLRSYDYLREWLESVAPSAFVSLKQHLKTMPKSTARLTTEANAQLF